MKRNTRMTVLALGLFAAVILATTSCGRDPIFHIIATETAPVPPLIRGGPTQMVVFNWPMPLEVAMAELEADGETELESEEEAEPGNGTRPVLFVASGDLFWYTPARQNNDGSWDNTSARWGVDIGITQPPGGRDRRIIDIAATRENLYVLSMTGTGVSTNIYRWNMNPKRWDLIEFPGSGNIQSVFADPAGGQLFAGEQRGGVNYIWHLVDGDTALRQLPTDSRLVNEQPVDHTGLLSGVAFSGGSYFLTTRNGVFQVGRGWLTRDDMARTFMGMIKLPDDTLIAIARAGGFLYRVNGDSLELERIPVGDDFMRAGRDVTGALALWYGQDPTGNTRKLLIVGIQGSRHATTFTNGYVEFNLRADGSLDTDEPRREAGSTGGLWSVNDTARYRTSLGRLPINHLFQTPWEIDADMTFFASTQTAGLWSYRDLEAGGWQWNAEADN